MRSLKLLSVITHPIWMTTAMMALVLFQKNSYLYYTISDSGRWFFISATFLLTAVAPAISIGYLKFTKQISSWQLENRKERLMPLAITSLYTFGLFYLFQSFNLPQSVLGIILGGAVGALVTLIITFYWKISAHTLALSGVCGMIYAFMLNGLPLSTFWIVGGMLLLGFVGYARLQLKSHTLSQVIAGMALGFPIAFAVVILSMHLL